MTTAQQMREQVLELIQGWLMSPQVRKNEVAVAVLNALAGDILVIKIKEPS